MHGSHWIKSYAETQSNVALSSAEAESYALVYASSESLGLKAMTQYYSCVRDPWLYVDASAAIGVAQRVGLGKIRHLDTQSLWIQQAVRKKQLGLLKVKGTENPADLMTKYLDQATMYKMNELMGLEVRTGRSAIAPQVAEGAVNAVAST